MATQKSAKPATAPKKPTATSPPAKPASPKVTKSKPTGKLTAIDAAAKVLGQSETPMTTRELIAAMADGGYWKSPAGMTPHATLYSALTRDIRLQGKQSRFKKVSRGKFAANV